MNAESHNQYKRTGSFLVEFENPYDLLSVKADTASNAAGLACKRLNRPAGDVFRVAASFEPAIPPALQRHTLADLCDEEGIERHFGYDGEALR